MKTRRERKRIRRRKCRHCEELYCVDLRHVREQKYCSKPECQKARWRSSWRRWFAKPENRNYFKGENHVERTRTWRAAHPEYWKRCRNRKDALKNAKSPQVTDNQADKSELMFSALQNATLLEPALVVGLIANLTGSALPNAIEETTRRYVSLGQDILGKSPGKSPKGGHRNGNKTHSMSGAAAAGAASIQLGRSPPGAGRTYR